MSDRPILFSAPMVRALLDGRKTQTRRVLKPQPMATSADGLFRTHSIDLHRDGNWYAYTDGLGKVNERPVPVTYAIGDRLWVREAWHTLRALDDMKPRELSVGQTPAAYEADTDDIGRLVINGRLRPGMFMPRWASRLTLTVTQVRVQRLWEITSADAIAEGYPPHANSQTIDCDTRDPRDDFKALWDSLNAKRAPWASNPWVVALTFTVAHIGCLLPGDLAAVPSPGAAASFPARPMQRVVTSFHSTDYRAS